MRNLFMKKINFLIPYLFILLMSIVVSIPLLSKNLNIYQDDGIQHICRLIGTWQTLKEGQFMPMIMSKYLNNFGYSWNIFYSPLTAFAPLLLKIFNMSFTQILKCFMFIVTFLSGITMYKCILKILNSNDKKSKIIASIGAMFYIFSPYRLTDMYIRVAIAELTSFIFIPIIFEGLYIILNQNKMTYLLALGVVRTDTNTYCCNYVYSNIMFYLCGHCNNSKDKKKRKYKMDNSYAS